LKVQQQQYNGVSSAGTFVQITDKGFAITGTSTNGNVLLFRTQPNIQTELLWQKTYGNGSGNAVISTKDGGFAIVGTKFSTVETEAKNTSWLIKTDSEGIVQWSKEYEGNGFLAIVNSSDSGYVMLGQFSINGTDYPGLLKVDEAGTMQWIKTYSSSEANVLSLYTLISTDDGGYGLVGEMQYTIYGKVMRNGWFVKTDGNGDSQVNRPFSLNGACVLHSVVETNDGGYFLAGATADSANGTYSACLLHTDWDGHMQYSRINSTIGSQGDRSWFEYYSAAKLQNGTFIVVGFLKGAGTTVEAVNSTGLTDHYEVYSNVSDANYVIPIFDDGFAFAGYKDGAIWFVEEYQVAIAVLPM
jgi:hypothetical protein